MVLPSKFQAGQAQELLDNEYDCRMLQRSLLLLSSSTTSWCCRWMPWIRSVTVQPDDPKLSRWLLSTHQFGRDWEFSWLAQNLTPMKHQKACIPAHASTISSTAFLMVCR